VPIDERDDASVANPEEPDSTYTLVRHASIGDSPASGGQLEWVVIAHWDFGGGHEEWYTEYWARSRNEEAPEELHASCDDAVAHAEGQFGALTWTPGGPPF
jgi:hypothetical protein